MKHYNIRVLGLVQGVFFRKYTEEKAKELGLKGFVMNKPDQSVYIEVEGDKVVLEQFVAWCHEGSPASRVEQVAVAEGELVGFNDFGIRK